MRSPSRHGHPRRADIPTTPDLREIRVDDELLDRLGRSSFSGTDALSRRLAAWRDKVRTRETEADSGKPSTFGIYLLLVLTGICVVCAAIVMTSSARAGALMLVVAALPTCIAGIMGRQSRPRD